MHVHQPNLLFKGREGVDIYSMSVLELMSELEGRGWEKKEPCDKKRRTPPYDVDLDSPKVWFAKSGGVPYKEYLQALLAGSDRGLKKVFHFQCLSYYQCLGVNPTVIPHQTAQYYKALMGRAGKAMPAKGNPGKPNQQSGNGMDVMDADEDADNADADADVRLQPPQKRMRRARQVADVAPGLICVDDPSDGESSDHDCSDDGLNVNDESRAGSLRFGTCSSPAYRSRRRV